MEQKLQALLQVSAKLYELLSTIPEGTERDEAIVKINDLLEEREDLIHDLLDAGFQFDSTIKMHETLFELDKGIRTRLTLHLNSIKQDIRDLNLAKQKEKNYTNPYGHVRVMDGAYYDKRK